MDQKSAFDAGYRSYEDGNRECDFGPNAAAWAGEERLTALWRAGWQRGREDSTLTRYDQAVTALLAAGAQGGVPVPPPNRTGT